MTDIVRIFHPRVALHAGGVALVCDRDGQMKRDNLHGFYAGDTRMLSVYQFRINDHPWQMLGHLRHGYGSMQWHFQNEAMEDADGPIADSCVVLTLTRRLNRALHDDFDVWAYGGRPLRLRLALQIDADFADLFEVKQGRVPARWRAVDSIGPDQLLLHYDSPGFRRALHLTLHTPRAPDFNGTELVFEFLLEHGGRWHCCLDAVPEIDGELLRMQGDPHLPESPPGSIGGGVTLQADEPLAQAFSRGQQDLRSLALPQQDAPPYPAAGIPWFLTLFGRDPLIASLMSSIDGAWAAEGALAALARHQADVRDDFRDAEPGKIPHELRHDELTMHGELPYSPYYGTHDAPAIYCLALWNAWRWTGRRELLDRHFDTAWRALCWCDAHGDRDGDGLQEYQTRSAKGYRNQSWKDSSSAVVDGDGRQPPTPLATVELQGYLYAARLAMAELLEARGDAAQANLQRERADALRELVEQRYWMERASYYAFALDGSKRQVDAVASNPGHLLWCGLPAPERARAVAARCIASDMFSGWGLRTLSADNPAYNPVSYQRGSVWPFDTLLTAAGLWRYGEQTAACILIKAVLDAAAQFESSQLPELYGGFPRAYGAPVPYHLANMPQAWSAATPLLTAQLMLGLVADAPHGRCYFQPQLPEWLPFLRVQNIRVGEGSIDISVRREKDATVVDHVHSDGVELIQAVPQAPLWGGPLRR